MLSRYDKSMENIFLLSEISFGSWDTGDGFTDECIADWQVGHGKLLLFNNLIMNLTDSETELPLINDTTFNPFF